MPDPIRVKADSPEDLERLCSCLPPAERADLVAAWRRDREALELACLWLRKREQTFADVRDALFSQVDATGLVAARPPHRPPRHAARLRGLGL